MRLLAIDTTCRTCSVALAAGGDIAWLEAGEGEGHAARVLPMAGELLAAAGMRPHDLDAVAFACGPGAFTGVRIACGVAQGMAFAAGLPVVPVGSLASLALEAGEGWVLACLDARMGEVYHATFRVTGDGDCEPKTAPAVCAPSELPVPDPQGVQWIGAGDGFRVHAEVLRERLAATPLRAVAADCRPHARSVARLGLRALAAGQAIAPERAAPLYVRNKVALDVGEQAALRARQAEGAR
ncbi:MAG: tRNA (adenosine(37)-N6)-threonylcarbamoyltransferase complex dimerization subunit type 1 TsaB [Pseudomonadota bacterium]|jgi:tRNA threonylcarbamoyladenosine biosynthesis protein TsaB